MMNYYSRPNRWLYHTKQQGRLVLPGRRKRFAVTLLAIVIGAVAADTTGPTAIFASAQDAPAATDTPNPINAPSHTAAPRSTQPLVGPVVHADALFTAGRAFTWRDGEASVLLLERDVSVAIGAYGFRAHRAVLRIDVEQHPAHTIRHISVYLHRAKPLHGPVQAEGEGLLVTVSTLGQLDLQTDQLRRLAGAPEDALVAHATQRIADHLAALAVKPLDVPPGDPQLNQHIEALRQARRQEIEQDTQRRVDERLSALEAGNQRQAGGLDSGGPSRPIMPKGGSLGFYADKIVLREGQNEGDESVLALLGGVNVAYQFPGGQQGLSLRAQNAVVLLAPGALGRVAGRSVQAGDVRGVYLEDNVIATDGQYTVRAPRVYYDLERNKAVLLEAVFYTWDVNRQVPIYVRAKQIRQESLTSWSANGALLTTSEFAKPHFAIAADQVTFRQQAGAGGKADYRFAAADGTLQWGDVPVFYWPKLAGNVGTIQDMAVPRVNAGFSRQDGAVVRTTWDLFSLAGQQPPDGVKLLGRADYLGKRGPALGINLDYDLPRMFGQLDGYTVLQDHAEDEIGERQEISFDGDTRGYMLLRHRQYLRDEWELSLEVSHVSDETFLEEYFQDQAELSKPYETSIYLKKLEEDRAFTFLAQADTMPFTPQLTTLQAPGYTVEKTPELGYYRSGVSLWGDRLTYSSETRLSRLRINAGEDSPSKRGFTPEQSQILFGIPATTTFDAARRAMGVPGASVLRADTRHEIQSPLQMGEINVVPYAAGRVTAYDDDFKEFAGEDDNVRLWGTVGVRAATQFSKVYDGVDNRTLDIHRLRHIVEPRLDVFGSVSTVNPEDIPVYDTDVESLHEGLGLRVGAHNVLQTQRGGPGRWRSVDWLSLSTDLVFRSDDTDVTTKIARFFSYRPEYSPGGDHFHSEMMWMVSDALAAVGEIVYSFEDDLVPLWRVGLSLQQTPRLSFFLDYSDIDALTSRLLTYGFNYELTRKYALRYRHTLDLGTDDGSRSIEVALERKLPRWRMIILARLDELDDEATFGLVLVPDGVGSSRRIQPAGTRQER